MWMPSKLKKFKIISSTENQMNGSQCYTAAEVESYTPIMKVQRKMQVYTYLPKYGCIVLSFAASVFIFMIYIMYIIENKVSTNITPKVFTPPSGMHYDPCTIQPLSAKEALEEHLLLKSIAWPVTPPVPSPRSLNKTSDPSHSTFTILPKREGGHWHIGDKLEVMIKMYDFQGYPKKFGGDVLLARLHSPILDAGVAGQLVDHLNGSYSAVFSLLWEGDAQVEVILVHPSEAVTELSRLNREQPDRIYFKSNFRSGSVTETTICNICLHPTQQPVCNYTNVHTGDPWFCYKPKNLNCDARITHSFGGYKENITATEKKLFQSGVNLKVPILASGSPSVTVMPNKQGQSEVSSSSVEAGPSGYYYQGVWRALGETPVIQYNSPSAITQCLKGKVIHLYGDSTIRQWFEHLNAAIPDLKEFDLHNLRQSGPLMTLDYKNNIMVTYRCHGPPIRFGNLPISELHYIASELDNVVGGRNTIVVIGIWSHFSTFPIKVYIRRLQSIRRGIVRLLSRAPDTLVVIRTANPKSLTLYETLTNSDWYSLQRDKVLRAIFKGLNVHLVDAWEMVLAYRQKHNLHPEPPIIKNMINVLLSYICPTKGG